jgi:hypothetical protein
MQSRNELENKQTGILSLDKSGTRSSIGQKKAPKSMFKLFFYGSSIFKYR